MLASSSASGVVAYDWQASEERFKCVAKLPLNGVATAVAINCNNQVLASGTDRGQVVLGLPDPSKDPLFKFEPSPGKTRGCRQATMGCRWCVCGGVVVVQPARRSGRHAAAPVTMHHAA